MTNPATPPVGDAREIVLAKFLYAEFWKRNKHPELTPWDKQAMAIREMWITIATNSLAHIASAPPPTADEARTLAAWCNAQAEPSGAACASEKAWCEKMRCVAVLLSRATGEEVTEEIASALERFLPTLESMKIRNVSGRDPDSVKAGFNLARRTAIDAAKAFISADRAITRAPTPGAEG